MLARDKNIAELFKVPVTKIKNTITLTQTMFKKTFFFVTDEKAK